uniref:Uncharacterized protein n=1 Tax=Rhizophora mucronata TaxID=61149 RepID=A0A2P2PSR5_RHIMU
MKRQFGLGQRLSCSSFFWGHILCFSRGLLFCT